MRVKFTTTLDSEILKELKIQAVKGGTDVSKILEKLMVEYLEKQKAIHPPPSFSLKRARKLRGGSILADDNKTAYTTMPNINHVKRSTLSIMLLFEMN